MYHYLISQDKAGKYCIPEGTKFDTLWQVGRSGTQCPPTLPRQMLGGEEAPLTPSAGSLWNT